LDAVLDDVVKIAVGEVLRGGIEVLRMARAMRDSQRDGAVEARKPWWMRSARMRTAATAIRIRVRSTALKGRMRWLGACFVVSG